MPRLFISHSTADRQFIEEELAGLLRALGFDIWYSKDSIETAEQWEQAIRRGLESSKWVVVLLSPRAARSRWVKAEISWAMEERTENLIPLLLEECNPLDFHLQLAQIQYIDFRDNLRWARERLINLLVEHEYKPKSLANLVTGLLECPSKEILTVVRMETSDEQQIATLIGANDCANRFYARIANATIIGTELSEIFTHILPQWIDKDDLTSYLSDQKRMLEAVKRGEEIYASIPMKINNKHPNRAFRGRSYLPITIAYSNPIQRDYAQIEDYLVLYLNIDEILSTT